MHSCWVAEKYERGAQGESPSTASIATDGGRHHDTLMRCEPTRTDAEIVRASTAAGHGTWGARGLAPRRRGDFAEACAAGVGAAQRAARCSKRLAAACVAELRIRPRSSCPELHILGELGQGSRLGPHPPSGPTRAPGAPAVAHGNMATVIVLSASLGMKTCTDTADWKNPYGATCDDFAADGRACPKNPAPPRSHAKNTARCCRLLVRSYSCSSCSCAARMRKIQHAAAGCSCAPTPALPAPVRACLRAHRASPVFIRTDCPTPHSQIARVPALPRAMNGRQRPCTATLASTAVRAGRSPRANSPPLPPPLPPLPPLLALLLRPRRLRWPEQRLQIPSCSLRPPLLPRASTLSDG